MTSWTFCNDIWYAWKIVFVVSPPLFLPRALIMRKNIFEKKNIAGGGGKKATTAKEKNWFFYLLG